MLEFVKRGIPILLPYGDNARYDLAAEFNGKLNRIQVKYCNHITKENSAVLICRSSTNHTTNKHLTTYENDVDYMAFYIPSWEESLLIPIEIIGDKKSMAIRRFAPKNNQSTVHYVSDFTFDKTLGETAKS